MQWYKFTFNPKELDDGIPVRILELIQDKIAEERKHILYSEVPIWYRSKVDDDTFYLKCVGWDIEKGIIHNYQGLPREESNLPPLEEFY